MSSTELIEFGNAGEWDGPYEISPCRRALSPSRLPGIDYALNPYGGCEHGCVYCYAPEVTHSDWAGWRVVRVRSNICERLALELRGVSGTIGVGTVTDPYQGAERRFELTRGCLEAIAERGARIHVHTKSDLVLRDIDLISRMRGEVGVTVTTLDDRRSKITEPGAPLPGRRLAAIRGLADAGVDVYALVGPVLDALGGREGELVDALAAAGARRVVTDDLNLRPGLAARLNRMGISGAPGAAERVRALAEARGMRAERAF
ncbi:MAG: radical SAM protein [Candidatus Methanoplasma sp.]|jgi:DNA repair photolyase|nr:radical SAM protein [Candidatus Methanoplasma sp.]